MPRRALLAALLLTAAAAALLPAAPALAGTLRAGAGRSDLTPPTGYFTMGWVRSDAVARGQHTRLFARAIVLEREGRKVALVAADLGAVAGGMVADAAELVKDRGFSERNVLVSASHTHAGPTGYFNFSTYNTVFMTAGTPTDFNVAGTLDPQLYAFMVRRLALAIRRADEDLAPAAAGWGSVRLLGVTENRSVEAHLADHGIMREYGEGSMAEDPLGPAHGIDPEVQVLRVDKVRSGGRRVPIGMWSTFAAHGTVNKYTFGVYNADHHGAATRVAEHAVRRAGRVPRRQEVVNAYGNTDEGDVSAGLRRSGPAAAEYVGRREARAMLAAWRSAGARLSRSPELDLRWTRVCFCGQETEGGKVDDAAVVGLPLFTGSEEGRGPLYDETKEPLEGRRAPTDQGAQGHKIQVSRDNSGGTPRAAGLMAVRVGDRMIVSVPGEMTAGMGERVREAVLGAAGGAGVKAAVISGLANEYLQYFTTPEEYERQHYEGGSTLYGRVSSNVLKLELAELARRLVRGEAAPEPYPYDPTNGVEPTAAPFDTGAERGTAVEQPSGIERLERAVFAWNGGPRGLDRPLDGAFVRIQRRARGRWRSVDDDLGLRVLWTADAEGAYRARWEAPLDAPLGTYRFVVTANRYRLDSAPFALAPATTLAVRRVRDSGGRPTVTLDYPAAVPERDITWRPRGANGGRVAFLVDGRRDVVRLGRGGFFSLDVPAGAVATIPAGAARDRFGNRNAVAFTLSR